MRKKDSVTHSMFNTPVSHNTESDDSDGEEMLPMGAFWPIPEEDWTVVEKSHANLRGTNGSDRDRVQNPGRKLDNSGLCCDELDDINDTEVLLINRSEATRIVDTPPEIETAMETAIVNVKLIVCKRPNVIVVVPSKITDGRVNCPVNVVLTPRVREHQNRGIGTRAGELFPEGLEVVPKEMAEEASTGDLADNQPQNMYELSTKTTVMNSTTKDDEIVWPAPRRVLVEVTADTSTDDTTIEKCTYGILGKNESTKRKVSTELLDISQQLITRGFLELAEEARIVKVEKTSSFIVEEVPPQITEVTRPMCKSVSWRIEEDLGQSVEGTVKVPTARFDVGQLMQWPDINSAGVMICGFMLESEMSSLGSVWCAAEPVSVATKSEMLTPVFAGGGGGGSLLWQPPWLW